MHRYAALLRGIGPSGPNMSNGQLRGVLERLGFDDVSSVLASGNLVFRSDAGDVASIEQRIEQGLAADLDLTSRTIVRSRDELRALLDSDPFHGLEHTAETYLTASFLKDPRQAPSHLPERLDSGTRVVGYDEAARAVLAVTDNREPRLARGFMTWLDRSWGKDVTTRSWLTVRRVVTRLEA